MENIQNNRLVRKFFKCSKCKDIQAQLVNPFVNNVYCSKCSTRINEISENDYRKYKNKEKIKQKEDIKIGNQMPYKPNEELLKKASDKYKNKPPSREHKHKHSNNNHKNNKDNKYNRHQSSTHYSNMNFNNMNNYSNNNNNINNINFINQNSNSNNNYNNINSINFNYNNNNNHGDRHSHERRENINNSNNNHHHSHNNRTRGHSMQPVSQNTNNFFSDFFRDMGFQPFMEFDFSFGNPSMFSNQQGHNPFRITIQRQNVANDIFDPIFSTFGSIFNGAFQDNFSSNFSSNYRGNFFDEIIRILERNELENRRNAHPPASEESLKKLKKFHMNEKYCKKNKKGKYELPNCCICLSEIAKGEKTVLLPCGHMFHWKCCLTWLKSNNTCPMCRFEIK